MQSLDLRGHSAVPVARTRSHRLQQPCLRQHLQGSFPPFQVQRIRDSVYCACSREEDASSSQSGSEQASSSAPQGSRGKRNADTDDMASEEGDSLVMPMTGVDTDWREFRARLVASSRSSSRIAPQMASEGERASGSGRVVEAPAGSWAHSLPRPEKGCLLLAHPMMFSTTQTYFFQAVILVLDHNEFRTLGVILNKPSTFTLSELSLTHALPEFDSCKLYCGGDVGGGEVTLLHTVPDLPGSAEVVRGLHMGGIQAAQAAVAAGKAKASDFRWFAKYSGWGPGQLESECRRGVWFTAAASPDVLLKEPTDVDGSDCWHRVLRLMGGDYERLSHNVIASEERHRMRRAAMQREQKRREQEQAGETGEEKEQGRGVSLGADESKDA